MDYPSKLRNIGIELISSFTTAKAKHKMQCTGCDHVWESTPISKMQSFNKYGTNGCPKCYERRKQQLFDTKSKDVIQRMEDLGFTILGPYVSYKNTLLVKNNNCGHSWETTPERIIGSNVQCKVCNDEVKIARLKDCNNKRSSDWKGLASDWELYKSDVRKLTEANYSDNISLINPHNVSRGKSGEPNAYQLDHIVPVRFCFDNGISAIDCSHPSNLQMLKWTQNLTKHNKIYPGHIPASMINHFKDDPVVACDLDFMNTISSLYPEAELYPAALSPYRVTFLFPNNNVAIRFHNITTSCEQRVGGSKMMGNMTSIADSKGIRLLHIYSDEWIHNRAILISKIAHMNSANDGERVHARKCSIREVPKEDRVEFLRTNHIQGPDKPQVSIGAYYEDRLVAVMTFCKPRVSAGKYQANTSGIWELSRFATDITLRVPGICSRLVAHFKSTNDWSRIFSYADLRHSAGGVYDSIGFTKVHTSSPSYYYVVDGVRRYRWNYRKDAIREDYPNYYDPKKTEYQMMLGMGIDRIWDAGKILYEIWNTEYV